MITETYLKAIINCVIMYNLKGNKILFLTSAILAAILITSIVLFVCFRLDDDE